MIDAHIHVVPPNLPGAGPLSPILYSTPEIVARTLIEQMQFSGTTRVMAMGEWVITPEDPLGVNRTLAMRSLVPELMAIGVMDPTRDPHDREHFSRVEQVIASGAVCALKGYLGYLHYDPGHSTYRRYYELAAQYRLPVFFHTGDTFSPRAKLKYAHPLNVDEVAVDHPDTRFIIAHVGNPWTLDAAEVIYKNMNVWADLSGLLIGDGEVLDDEAAQDGLSDLRNRISTAIRFAERPNRFIYGSDWPLFPMKGYREFIASLFPEDYHEQVFAENAALLFHLE